VKEKEREEKREERPVREKERRKREWTTTVPLDHYRQTTKHKQRHWREQREKREV